MVAYESSDLVSTLRVGINQFKLSVRQFRGARRFIGVITVLYEALLTERGARGDILVQSSPVDCCTLQTFTPMGVRGVGIWGKATNSVRMCLVQEHFGFF